MKDKAEVHGVPLAVSPYQHDLSMEDETEASSVPPAVTWRSETNSMNSYGSSVHPFAFRLADYQEGAVSPPSFAQSEFETIIRRQKPSRGLKILDSIPSRFPYLDNDWEFAGWGSMRYLELSDADLAEASRIMSNKPACIDQYRASSIAGNSVAGSVFYAFPAVASVAGIFSPISLAAACLMVFLYKPILQELGSAVPLNGANYTYLLQFSGKTLGLIGAASSLLDAAATSTVSSATAAAYLQGEFGSALPLSVSVLTILLLVVFALMALFHVRESSTVTFSFTLFHITSMGLLFGFSVASWAHQGSEILLANWALRPLGSGNTARAIFYGICLGSLAPTGFECTPAYIEVISETDYPFVLRNLLIASLLLNAPLMLLVYAHLPAENILSGANVLSLLAERVAGKWLRYLIVVDAIVILSGGILTGLFTACELLENLATSGILPRLFTRTMPITGGPVFSATLFLVGCIVMFVSSGFSLPVVSNVFSVAFLVVMLLYTLSNMMLKFNRDRLPRRYRVSILTVFITAALTVVVLVGNVALKPAVIGLFASYFITLLLGLFAIKSQARLARLAIWLYDQIGLLRTFKYTKGLDTLIVKAIRRNRCHDIGVFVKGDDIYHLMESVLYVRRNEPTARIIFIHAYQTIESIPSELGPNIKILDEAFPSITLDLVFLQGTFTPTLAQAASVKMAIPRTQMFMSTPGHSHSFRLADYRGLRVIHR